MTTTCTSAETDSQFVQTFMGKVTDRNPNEPEFLQAVYEVVSSLEMVVDRRPQYLKAGILDRIVEPELPTIQSTLG